VAILIQRLLYHHIEFQNEVVTVTNVYDLYIVIKAIFSVQDEVLEKKDL